MGDPGEGGALGLQGAGPRPCASQGGQRPPPPQERSHPGASPAPASRHRQLPSSRAGPLLAWAPGPSSLPKLWPFSLVGPNCCPTFSLAQALPSTPSPVRLAGPPTWPPLDTWLATGGLRTGPAPPPCQHRGGPSAGYPRLLPAAVCSGDALGAGRVPRGHPRRVCLHVCGHVSERWLVWRLGMAPWANCGVRE